MDPDDGLTFEVPTTTMTIRWPGVVVQVALDDETIERFRDLLGQRLEVDRSPTG